jgi:hypothetical protein
VPHGNHVHLFGVPAIVRVREAQYRHYWAIYSNHKGAASPIPHPGRAAAFLSF